MIYRLYGDLCSGSAIIEMALVEIGAPVELHPVSLDRDEQRSAEYRRVNPMGRVPALVLPGGPGDEVLTESLAILLTLCDRHPDAGLLPPADDPARAKALRWMALAAGEFYPAVTRNDYPERFSTDPAHAPAIREAARASGREFWTLVERDAGLAPFLLGERFSAADLYLAVMSRWMDGAAWLPAACPGVEGLARQVAARPAAGPIWRKHFGAERAAGD